MDFKTQVAPVAGLPGVAADALLVLVAGTAQPAGLEMPLAETLAAAVKAGDFSY